MFTLPHDILKGTNSATLNILELVEIFHNREAALLLFARDASESCYASPWLVLQLRVCDKGRDLLIRFLCLFACRPIGKNSRVYAEPSVLPRASREFAVVDQMLDAAEKICGPYSWGCYDILVLPPSFPYGGMENPNLTFVTPTILVSPRQNEFSNVFIHELISAILT